MRRAFPLGVLLFAACTGGPPRRDPEPGPADRGMLVIVTPPPTSTEGELIPVTVTIRNATGDPVLLEELRLGGAVAARWRTRRAGVLTYDGAADAWEMRTGGESETEDVFTTGWCEPGEELRLPLMARASPDAIAADLSWYAVDAAFEREHVYYPHRDGDLIRLRHDRPAAGEFRTVLFRPTLGTPEPRRTTAHVQTPCTPREFSWTEAASRVPGRVAEAAWFQTHGSWAVRTDQGSWLVHPARTAAIPAIDFRVLDVIDASGSELIEVEFEGATHLIFTDRFAMAPIEGGVRGFLSPAEAALLLMDLDAAAMTIEVRRDGPRVRLCVRPR